jgi:hypothetical protein
MKDEKGIRRGWTLRRLAFAIGAVGATYFIYMGDIVGVLCWGAISVIAAVSKLREKVRNARKNRSGNGNSE